MLNFKKLGASFRNAFEGLKLGFRQQSFRLQILFAGLVIVLMFRLPLHNLERTILVLAISLVLGLELLNSQLEKVLDLLQRDHDPKIKSIKDLSAAAVLIVALGAAIIGFLIFFPYLY